MVIPGNGNDDCSLALSFSILASSLARTPLGARGLGFHYLVTEDWRTIECRKSGYCMDRK